VAIIYVMTYNELAIEWPHYLPTCVEKGYPEIVEEGLSYWVVVNNEGEPLAYTCSKNMGNWVFVGNTYVRKKYRGRRLHSLLLEYRNLSLGSSPKVTIVNPLDDTEMEQLEEFIIKKGYSKVVCPEDVADIMDEVMYWYIECPGTTLWRLG